MKEGGRTLKFPLNGKYVAMLAPSFVVDFSYPKIIPQLKELGFEKVVELTFGAKMINREYSRKLKSSKEVLISSVCPGIVEFIKHKFSGFQNNLVLVDSPMIATAKICKKVFPKHKIVFISPCGFKKIEAEKSGLINFVLTFKELKDILRRFKIKEFNQEFQFDRFYNDYTKIYPVSGGLSKTVHLKNLVFKKEVLVLDGVSKVERFLKNPNKNIKFLDVTFCEGGCIGGPCIQSKLPLFFKRLKVINYLRKSKREDIPEIKKGLISKAKGLSFTSKNL